MSVVQQCPLRVASYSSELLIGGGQCIARNMNFEEACEGEGPPATDASMRECYISQLHYPRGPYRVNSPQNSPKAPTLMRVSHYMNYCVNRKCCALQKYELKL